MKLISLNAWGGTQNKLFFDYIKEQAKTTDIFCFQEIFSSELPAPKISSNARMYLLEELEEMLPEFMATFAERKSGYDFNGPVNFPTKHGLAIFVKKELEIISSYTKIVREELNTTNAAEGVMNIQVLQVALGGKKLSVMNYHGPAMPGDKQDTKERIHISNELKAIWEDLPDGAKILCGDFNLYPDTQSIQILETCGKNLIKEFKIENTRNEVSWEKFNNKQYFADFAFVSPKVKVNSFKVPYNLVSDHLPLELQFDI